MNPTLITDLLTYALPSGFLAGTVTWLVSRRKRRNDMLADMQRSIDLLCEKYNDVLQENVTLRREKADWLVAQQELLRKIDKLTREVEGLRKNFNRKTQKKPMKPPRRKKRPVLLPLLLLTAAGCATTRTTTQTSDIQTRIHSERSVEKSQRDSLVRQLRQQQQESDSTSRTLLIATESLPTDRTRLAIPLKDLERLPPGCGLHRPQRTGRDPSRKTGRFAHRHRYKRPSGTAYMAADKPDFPAAAAIGQPRKPYRSAKPFLLRPRYDPPA